MIRLANIISTWFGCGRSPFAPGTVGSAAAIVLAIAIERFTGLAPFAFCLLAALLFIPATWAAGVSARAAQLKDPQFVVVDEVIGQWIALAGARTAELEKLPSGVRAVPAVRHLEAGSGTSTGAPSRRSGHQRR